MRDEKASSDNVDIPLFWDSWDRHRSRASVPSEGFPHVVPMPMPINNNAPSHYGPGIQRVHAGGSVSTLVPSCSVSSINSLVLSDNKCSPTPPLTPPVFSKGKGTDALHDDVLA